MLLECHIPHSATRKVLQNTKITLLFLLEGHLRLMARYLVELEGEVAASVLELDVFAGDVYYF